jgi:hypothetical protein
VPIWRLTSTLSSVSIPTRRRLIELIEALFLEWYVDAHKRQLRLGKIKAIAADKAEQKKVAPLQNKVVGDDC